MPHDLQLWCEDCQKGYEGACTEHGPLTHVSDTETGTRARRSLPKLLELHEENNQIGIYARSALSKRLQFGPLQGVCEKVSTGEDIQAEAQIKARFNIVYKLVQENGNQLLLNTLQEDQSNWMIFVRAAEQKSEQNLVAFQYRGDIFFATIKEIPAKTELKVWYSKDYAERLGATVLSDDSSAWQFRTRSKFTCVSCKISFSSASSLKNHKCPKSSKAIKKESVLRARRGKKLGRLKVSPPSTPTKDSGPSTSYAGRTRTQKTPVKEIPGDSSDSDTPTKSGKALPFRCSICQKQFQSPGKLRQHSYSHTGEKPFVCTLCDKSFDSRFKLGRHQLIHTSERQHRCSVCDRSFRRKDHLKNHIQIHDPNKQYKCVKKDCGKEYSSFMSYKKHCAVHSAEEGDLECKICSEMFDNKEDLIYHLKVHVGAKTVKSPNEKKFQCDHCDRKFFTRKDVKRHLVVHTGKRDFVCSLCPQKFGRKDHLVRHIKKSHGVVDLPKPEVDPSLPGPSTAAQVRSPEIGVTSSTSSGEHSFSPLLVSEEFSAEPPAVPGPSGLSTVDISQQLSHPGMYSSRSFGSELKYFEGVKEDPDLTTVEGLGANTDDLFKILGMYLPPGSMTSSSLLDPTTSSEGDTEQMQDPSLAHQHPQALLLEGAPIYHSSVMDPLVSGSRIQTVSSPSIIEYQEGQGLPRPEMILSGEDFLEPPVSSESMEAGRSESTSSSTTTTITTTTSLPGFDQAFP